MTDEREKWMPPFHQIEDAYRQDADQFVSGGGRVEALIRRAALDRAIEELENVLDLGSVGDHVQRRLAALRAEREEMGK